MTCLNLLHYQKSLNIIDQDDFVKHGMSSLQADKTERVQWIRRASSKILL